MTEPRTLPFRLICKLELPERQAGAQFGLQDKSGNLLAGEVLPDGALVFNFELKVEQMERRVHPNWTGRHAFGTPDERFLYLSFGTKDGDGWNWIHRIKGSLAAITWAMVEEALRDGRTIIGTVTGTKGAWAIVTYALET